MNWLELARELQSIAQAGLTYSADPYDLQRFARLREIAAEIADDHSALPSGALAAFTAEAGYATPKVDVRAAVFRDDQILLVRERREGRWSLPGGWADVGQTPSECAVREVWEESGFRVRATRVIGVFDRDRQGHPPSLWAVYRVFFACDILGGEPTTSLETDAVAFFPQDGLPPLSLGRVTPHQIARAFRHYADPSLPTDFD